MNRYGQTQIYQEILQEGHREGHQKGWQEGLQEGLLKGELLIILRFLQRKFGIIDTVLNTQLQNLSVVQLGKLADSILEFNDINDLKSWLQDKSSPD